jgi:hypothetical protein
VGTGHKDYYTNQIEAGNQYFDLTAKDQKIICPFPGFGF